MALAKARKRETHFSLLTFVEYMKEIVSCIHKIENEGLEVEWLRTVSAPSNGFSAGGLMDRIGGYTWHSGHHWHSIRNCLVICMLYFIKILIKQSC